LARKLIVMNGRGDYGRNRTKKFPKGFDGHFYVCAESKAEAVRLLKQAGYETMNIRELDTYWSVGCWGTAMQSLVPIPEKGVWFITKERERQDGFKPIRVL
jgi:hypothetical protein